MNSGYDSLKYALVFVNDCWTRKKYFWEVISIVYTLMWVDFFQAEYPFKKYFGGITQE